MENTKDLIKSKPTLCLKYTNKNKKKDILTSDPSTSNYKTNNQCDLKYDGTREENYAHYGKLELQEVIKQLITHYDTYKFTVYRCAAKIVALQKILHTSNLPYKIILSIMEHHNVNNAEPHLMIPPFQLTSLIYDIYHACKRLGYFHYSIDTATTNLSGFIWDVYDPRRRYSISITEIKLTLILLCKSFTPHQLILEIFNTVASTSKSLSITKLNFESILNTLIKLLTYLGEGNAYGQHNLRIIMHQCFVKGVTGINTEQFQYLWYSSHTLFAIYGNLLSLVKRIQQAETLIHNHSCDGCHCSKISGIRFQCRTCKDYSLCLKCFAVNGVGNCSNNNDMKHPFTHKFYEIYSEDVKRNKSLLFYIEKFCLQLFCSTRNLNDDDKDIDDNSEAIIQLNNSLTQRDLDTIKISPPTSNTSRHNNYNIPHITGALRDTDPLQKTAASSIEPLNSAMESRNDVSVHFPGLTRVASNALNVSEKLQVIIDKLLLQNGKLEQQLKRIQCSASTLEEVFTFLDKHQKFVLEIIREMRTFSSSRLDPIASTPHRFMISGRSTEIDNLSVIHSNDTFGADNQLALFSKNNKNRLSVSIYGAEINRTYLEANKSDYSLKDISVWYSSQPISLITNSDSKIDATCMTQQVPLGTQATALPRISETAIFTALTSVNDMPNFKLLIQKVKEVIENSFGNNVELSETTQNIENIMNSIIKSEESL